MNAPNPFHRVPTFRFLTRWGLYMIPFYLALGIVGVGIGAQMPPFAPPLEKPLGVDMELELPKWTDSAWPPVVAHSHYERFALFSLHFPRVCLPGREINEFQVGQCAKFRMHFVLAGALALLPLLVLLVGISMGKGKLLRIYEFGATLISGAAPGVQGTVTNPAQVSGDFFSWLYGFKTIAVQLPNGEQKVIYIPSGMIIPLPGQKFRIFNMGRYLGQDRFTGILHAPHMAVVSGSR